MKTTIKLLTFAISLVLMAHQAQAGPSWKTATIKSSTKKIEVDAKWPVLGVKAADDFLKMFVKSQVDGFTNEFKNHDDDGKLYGLYISWEGSNPVPGLTNVELIVSVYTGGAHPNNGLSTFVFDAKTGKRLFIHQLFKDKNLFQVLSKESRPRIKKELGEGFDEEMVNEGTAPKEDNFMGYAFEKNDLVLKFGSYQVAPYAAGMPKIRIPYKAIQGHLNANFLKTYGLK